MGLLSPGGVHSHQNHLAYMSKLVANLGFKVQVHAFLDGRDTPPKRAIEFLGDFFQSIQNDSNIHLATFMGRYFAMDRDKRWDRIEKAYQAIAASKGLKFHTVQEGITRSYEQGISDEFVIPQISQE